MMADFGLRIADGCGRGCAGGLRCCRATYVLHRRADQRAGMANSPSAIRHSPSARKGFSLVELIIAMTITAMLRTFELLGPIGT